MSNEATVKLKLLLQNHITTPLMKAKQQLSGVVGEMKDSLNSLKEGHIKAFSAMKDEIPGMGRAIELLTNPYVLATAAVLAFGTASVKAAQWSNTWQQNMAEVNTTAQLSKSELDKLSNKLVDIGTRNVAPLEEIPQAFNRIISAGLDANTALSALEPTLRAAKAGFTDVETVAAAGVGVMASSGEDINRVYDILFATLNKGNAKFQDIAQYLPKIVPLAKNAGYALAESAGAWAFLTAQGQSAEQATTGVMALMRSLSDTKVSLGQMSGGKYTSGFKSIGIDVFDTSGKIKSLTQISELLGNKLAGMTDKQRAMMLTKVGMDQEGIRTLSSMVQNQQKLKETIDFTTNSQGQLNNAYKNAATDMDDFKMMMNQLKANVVKPLGDAIMHTFGSIARWINKTDITTTIENERVKVNALALEMSDSLTPLARRNELYNELKGINPSIVDGIKTETMEMGKLNGNLEAYNLLQDKKIAVANSQKTLNPLRENIDSAARDLAELRTKLASGIVKDINTTPKNSSEYKQMLAVYQNQKKSLYDKAKEISAIANNRVGGADAGMLYYNIDHYKKQETVLTNARKQLANEQKKQNEILKLQGVGIETPTKAKGASTDTTTGKDGTNTDTKGKPKKDETLDAGADKVAGSAQQIKNLVVNIDSFNKGGINTQNTELQHMDGNQIADWFDKAMLRMIRNLEMSY